MSKMKKVFILEWDENELGSNWMNIDNLRSCLYGETCTIEALCKVRELPQVHSPRKGLPDGVSAGMGGYYIETSRTNAGVQ